MGKLLVVVAADVIEGLPLCKLASASIVHESAARQSSFDTEQIKMRISASKL